MTRHADLLAGAATSLRVTTRVATAVMGAGAGEEPAVPGPRRSRVVVLDESEALGRQVERMAATYLPHVEVVRGDCFEAVDALLATCGGSTSCWPDPS